MGLIDRGTLGVLGMRLIAPLLLMVLMAAGAASADDYYVSTTGDNSTSGNITHPWQNVSYATQQATAGDTIHLFNGTWYDEHVTFANSGNSTHPITMKAYNGTWVLDGVDWSGSAMTIVDKSNLTISDFDIRNYGEGISGGSGHSQNITLSNFTIEDINGIGIDFDTTVLQDSLITNFTMQNISDVCITHMTSSPGTCNITISDFVIRDVSSEAIHWRHSDNICIEHGEIYNTGGDAIHYHLSINNSTIDDVYVNNTGFHGLCIHDWTEGTYPCYNNIIKNCYVGYATHNNIDLHSAGFNTTVENCTVHGELATGQGIYIHVGGSDFIVRNNTISNVSDGIESNRPNVTIENNTIYNITNHGMYLTAYKHTVRDNEVYDVDGYAIFGWNATTISLERNNIHQGSYRAGQCVEAETIDMAGSGFYVRSGEAGNMTFKYSDGKVYSQVIAGSNAPYSVSSPEWYPNGSRTLMDSSATGRVTIVVTTYNVTLLPTNSYLKDVVVNRESNSTHDITNISINSSVSSNPVWINATMQNASANYNVSVDGSIVDYIIADSDRIVRYNYTSSWSSHDFEFNWVDQGTFSPDHSKSYYNATSSIQNTINSTGYITYDRTLGWGDTVRGSGSLKVTT